MSRRALLLGDLGKMPAEHKRDGFDVVSCLNVLDRCDFPLTLLQQMRSLLKDDSSLLVLATPLPFSPSVEDGRVWRECAA